MKRIQLSLLFVILLTGLNAQIKVATNNCVGIAEEAPVSELSVNDPGKIEAAVYFKNDYTSSYGRALQTYNYQSSGSYGFGILSSIANTSSLSADFLMGIKASAYKSPSIGSNRSYGVFGVAGGATSGFNYGVYGQILGSSNGAAIFASTPGKYDCNVGDIWAGYFRGNVYVENDLIVDGTYYPSDIRMKKDIRPLKTQALQIEAIKTLSPIKYKYKTPLELNLIDQAVLDTSSVNLELEFSRDVKYTRDNIGLSAQEVKAVYPELIKENADGYLSINYTGLIPVLIEATKEQQTIIEELQSELLKMKTEIENLKALPIK